MPVGTGPWAAPALPAAASTTMDATVILVKVRCTADDARAVNFFFIAVSLVFR